MPLPIFGWQWLKLQIFHHLRTQSFWMQAGWMLMSLVRRPKPSFNANKLLRFDCYSSQKDKDHVSESAVLEHSALQKQKKRRSSLPKPLFKLFCLSWESQDRDWPLRWEVCVFASYFGVTWKHLLSVTDVIRTLNIELSDCWPASTTTLPYEQECARYCRLHGYP